MNKRNVITYILLTICVLAALLFTLYAAELATGKPFTREEIITILVWTLLVTIVAILLYNKDKIFNRKKKKARINSVQKRSVSISVTCDEYYVADFLRELANHIEAMEDDENYPTEYESFHGAAEFDFEK